ncbi:hypothetical protein BVY03_01005, partial [bacterium K02(2017)]
AMGPAVTIKFDITSCYTGTCLITPFSDLPSLTSNNITIDGYSQSGALANSADFPNLLNGTLKVQIDDANGGTFGISFSSHSNTIKGLIITGFSMAVDMTSSTTNNRLQGNYIGVEADGVTSNGATGGEVIKSNQSYSYIGTDGDGTNEAAERNVIGTGSATDIINLFSGNNMTIAGNYIGLGIDGNTDIGASGVGISVLAKYTIIGTNGDGVSDSVEGNVISRNGTGIQITSAQNIVAGNIIGLRPLSNNKEPNSVGIYIASGDLNRIGTNGDETGDTAERNVISGNTTYGIHISGALTGTRVAGNYVGVGTDGSTDFGNNDHGIYVLGTASDGTIGGTIADETNIIAYNGDGIGESGIYLTGAATDQIRILRNSMFSNEQKG